MVDRFDLEESLMVVDQTSADLDLITERLVEGEAKVTSDETANVLIGLSYLHKYRSEKDFNIFDEMVHSGQFKDEHYRKENKNE